MTSRNKSWRDDIIRPELPIRKFSNRLIEMVEEGILDPVGVVRMCVKYMSEDEVKDMCDCNELTDLMFEPDIEKVNKYIKVLGYESLKKYYNDPTGNLYFAHKGEKTYEVVDSFLFYELYDKLTAGLIDIIYIECPSLGTKVEVE